MGDTLDADESGELDLPELIKGLCKLRGAAEKSDVIAAVLSVRSVQKSLHSLELRVTDSYKGLLKGQRRLEAYLQGGKQSTLSTQGKRPPLGYQRTFGEEKKISTRTQNTLFTTSDDMSPVA